MHDRWSFTKESDERVVKVNGNRVSDDGELVRRWALAGHGLAYKSHLDVLADLRAGRLETALDDWRGEPAPVNLISTHRLAPTPALSRLRDFLQASIAAYLGAR